MTKTKLHPSHSEQHSAPYRVLLVLLIMTSLSFGAMYILMYAMVDEVANIYWNINQAYMAGLMTAPMILIELVLMRKTYSSTKVNIVVAAVSVTMGIFCFAGIRAQLGVSDKQFLRSMIPHHAGAILMCEQASLQAAEIAALCQGIRAGQRTEINQMAAKLQALGE